MCQPTTGVHPVYVWLQDTLDRASTANAANTTLYWDTTPPGPPSNFTPSPARQWTNINNFSEGWRNPTDLSGIAGAYYKLDDLPASPIDGTFVNTTDSISNIQVPDDRKHTIFVWLVDGAGNLDSEARNVDWEVFWYDATKPVSAMLATPKLPATGWYTTSVVTSFSATDTPPDDVYPPVVYYQLDGGAWTLASSALTVSAEGAHSLKYQALDKADNSETAREFAFGIDTTPPTATLHADRLPNSTGWYTSSVTYALSVVDGVSGSPQAFYRLDDGAWQTGAAGVATFSLAAGGSYRIEYYGQDAAGNRSELTVVEAYLDVTPPSTTHVIDGVLGNDGWYVSNPTIQLTPQDAVSGVATTSYRIDDGPLQTGTQFVLAGDGRHVVTYYSTDAAGNAGAPATVEVKLDTAAPGAPLDLWTWPVGWSRVNWFTVHWINPGDASGVTGAYYKLGALSGDGAPTGPKDGVVVTGTQHIEGFTVPAEGAYRLYLWLRDTAGNSDEKTAPGTTPPPEGPVLRYDATPPLTAIEPEGQPGQGDWWLSPISITLTGTDGASGIAALHYRVDGGEWQVRNNITATLSIDQPNQHVVEYYAEDIAGNFEQMKQYIAQLDFTAPPAVSFVQVLPQGWTRTNSFHIDWSTVTDLSDIAGAYVKFDAAPSSATDGDFYAGSTHIDGVKVPGEGKHSAYVWLRDGAGNADNKNAVEVTDSAWYDGTPPTSVITPTAPSGSNGWYVEPAAFDVSATDAASGVREVQFQIDDGATGSATAAQLPSSIRTATRFIVSEEGQHTVRIWAVDQAGNAEPAQVYPIKIDRTSPRAILTGPSGPVTQTQFDVSWTGEDYQDGSGVASYDVQVRDGYDAAWQDWKIKTQATSAQFEGQRGHTYFFRVFGRDGAGNYQTTPGTSKVLVQPVINGHFDTGVFSDWTYAGPLVSAVVATTGPANVSTLAAQLGTEAYGPSLTPPGQVPAGCATISQAISIPGLEQVKQPRLRFWYRVLSYDVMYSVRLQSYVDTLDVKLTDSKGQQIALLLRAGNPTDTYKVLYDTGWRLLNANLKDYAGQKVNLVFANCNGPQNGNPDNMYNTWSYVDSVEIYDNSWLYLPLVRRASPGASSAAAAAEATPAAPDEATPTQQGEVDPAR